MVLKLTLTNLGTKGVSSEMRDLQSMKGMTRSTMKKVKVGWALALKPCLKPWPNWLSAFASHLPEVMTLCR